MRKIDWPVDGARIVIVTATLFAATAGCGPKIRVGFRDPSLTQSDLAARGIAIGGMTSTIASAPDPIAARAALDTLLWTRLSGDLEGVPLRPLTAGRPGLAQADRDLVLSAYEASEGLTAESRALLAMLPPDSVPYLLFGCIDKDRVWTDQTRDPGTDKMLNITLREIEARFELFDCRLGRTVWRGRLSLRRSTGKQAPEDKPFTLGNVVEEILFPNDDPDYEPPPEMWKMIWTLFGGVSKALTEG
jgi:hypothetical protein